MEGMLCVSGNAVEGSRRVEEEGMGIKVGNEILRIMKICSKES